MGLGADATKTEAMLKSKQPEPFINEHEAAEYLGVSVKTMRRRRWVKLPPVYYKLGSSVRYRRSDLESWIRRVEPSPRSKPSRAPCYPMPEYLEAGLASEASELEDIRSGKLLQVSGWPN